MGTTEYIELVSIVIAGGGAAWAFGWAAYRAGCRIVRAIPISDRLHALFGVSPIDELHEILRDLQGSVGEIEIRQRIAERHLQIGIYVCAVDGKCTWANDYLCHSFGLDSSEMRGFGWLAAISKDEQQRVHHTWVTAVREGLPYQERYRVVPVDGSEEWKATTVAEPVIVDSEIQCFVGYISRDRHQ